MSEQSDSHDALRWGGLQLGIELGLIEPGTTEDDVKRDREKHNQLKNTYELLKRLGVGKVNGKFVDTSGGIREKVMSAAADNAAAAKTRRSVSR
jgi:hypothetical protein